MDICCLHRPLYIFFFFYIIFIIYHILLRTLKEKRITLQSCLSWCPWTVCTHWRGSSPSFLWTWRSSVLLTEARNKEIKSKHEVKFRYFISWSRFVWDSSVASKNEVISNVGWMCCECIAVSAVPVLSSVVWFLGRIFSLCGECRASSRAGKPGDIFFTWAVWFDSFAGCSRYQNYHPVTSLHAGVKTVSLTSCIIGGGVSQESFSRTVLGRLSLSRVR